MQSSCRPVRKRRLLLKLSGDLVLQLCERLKKDKAALFVSATYPAASEVKNVVKMDAAFLDDISELRVSIRLEN